MTVESLSMRTWQTATKIGCVTLMWGSLSLVPRPFSAFFTCSKKVRERAWDPKSRDKRRYDVLTKMAHNQFSRSATLPIPSTLVYGPTSRTWHWIPIPGSPSFLVYIEKIGESGDEARGRSDSPQLYIHLDWDYGITWAIYGKWLTPSSLRSVPWGLDYNLWLPWKGGLSSRPY